MIYLFLMFSLVCIHFCKFNKVKCCLANLLTENGSAAAANYSVTCRGEELKEALFCLFADFVLKLSSKIH